MQKLLVRYNTHPYEKTENMITFLKSQFGNTHQIFYERRNTEKSLYFKLLALAEEPRMIERSQIYSVLNRLCLEEDKDRQRLNAKARKRGYLPVDIHLQALDGISLFYSTNYKSLATSLRRHFRDRYSIIYFVNWNVNGSEIVFDLPAVQCLHTKSDLIRTFIEPYENASMYTYAQNIEQEKLSKNFLSEAIAFLLSRI